MKPKNKVFTRILSWYIFSLMIFILIILTAFPTFIAYGSAVTWAADPYNLINLARLILAVLVMPIAQLVWFLVLISAVSKDLPFIEEFKENLIQIEEIVLNLEKDLRKDRRGKT